MEQSDERVVLRAPVRKDFLQEYGVVQGGILSALADTAAVYLLITFLDEGKRMSGVEFKINFLNPGSADGGDLVATSRVVKKGRTIAVCESEVEQDGRPLAHGIFTYLIY